MKINNILSMYYANNGNAGDVINPIIVRDLFGLTPIRMPYGAAKLVAIGSHLVGIYSSNRFISNVQRKFYSIFLPKMYIWGSGFLSIPSPNRSLYRKNIVFTCLRGELSKKIVEDDLGKVLDIPTADPGLLVSRLLKFKPKSRYNVGIIPHFREKDHNLFQKMLNEYDNSVMIDLEQPPYDVLNLIASCSYIISSSLHGLIFADSFGIPNIHVVVSNKLAGDGFKFEDYYSSYGLAHRVIDVNSQPLPTVQEIADGYQISSTMVNRKIDELIASFPFDSCGRRKK
jgi:hypothetical protein